MFLKIAHEPFFVYASTKLVFEPPQDVAAHLENDSQVVAAPPTRCNTITVAQPPTVPARPCETLHTSLPTVFVRAPPLFPFFYYKRIASATTMAMHPRGT
jgi:hypothetical protein